MVQYMGAYILGEQYFIDVSLLIARKLSNKNHTDAVPLALIRLIVAINATGNRCCSVIEEIVVKLSISSTKLELFEEQRVIV